MENSEIIEKMLKFGKGSYVKLSKKKDLGSNCVKISDMVIRLGIDYYNMEGNKEKERKGLKWGRWVEGLEGYVIENKGNYYLRIYNNGNNVVSKSKYLLNGIEVEKIEIVNIVGDKKLESSKSDCYDIKFENILGLGEYFG